MSDRWRTWRGFIAFVAVMLLFRSAIADWNQVPSGSMQPSILTGDRIVVDKLSYGLRLPFTPGPIVRWGKPVRGDVVTFDSPEDGRLLVKRVVGLPGDVVAMTGNRLVVNGTPAIYESLADGTGAAEPGHVLLRERVLGSTRPVMVLRAGGDPALQTFAPVRVPAGYFLVLGDNRDNSRDSRVIGFVARDRIVGKATRVAFSLDYGNHYLPRLDRFLVDVP